MIFQRGGGGHTVSNNIVMAFSPRNIVGTGTPGPPLATPLILASSYRALKQLQISCLQKDVLINFTIRAEALFRNSNY